MKPPLRPLRTKADHQAALAEIATLIDAAEGTAEADRLAVLAVLTADYERRIAPLSPPDATAVLDLSMQMQGKTQADLAEALNSRSRASEILARRRALSPQMADTLARLWAIPRHLLGVRAPPSAKTFAKGAAGAMAAIALLGASGVWLGSDLPSIEPVLAYSTNAAPLAALPPHVTQAFLAAEDSDFYRHRGFDARAIARASFDSGSKILSGHKPDGGATITQQVVKNLLLREEKPSLRRKVREILLAQRLEAALPKDRILEIYLSELYFGGDVHGLEAAATHYFNIAPDKLSIGQAAYLAALPKAPNAYRFDKPGNSKRALARRDWVLTRMQAQGFVTLAAAQQAQAQPLMR